MHSFSLARSTAVVRVEKERPSASGMANSGPLDAAASFRLVYTSLPSAFTTPNGRLERWTTACRGPSARRQGWAYVVAGRQGHLLPGPVRKTGAGLENAGGQRGYKARSDRGAHELNAKHGPHSEHAPLRRTPLRRLRRLKSETNYAWHRPYSRTPNV